MDLIHHGTRQKRRRLAQKIYPMRKDSSTPALKIGVYKEMKSFYRFTHSTTTQLSRYNIIYLEGYSDPFYLGNIL